MARELKEKDIISVIMVNELNNPLACVSSLKLETKYVYHLPSRMFDKTMYVVYNGKLCQFRIKKEFIYPFTTTRTYRNGLVHLANVYLIEVAGHGEMYVLANMYHYDFDMDIFESVEDFKAGKKINLPHSTIEVEDMNRIYNGLCTFDDSYHPNALRYTWNGTSAESYKFSNNVSLYIMYDGKNFTLPSEMYEQDYYGYATKEDCEKDNAIQVACFADDDSDDGDEDVDKVIKFTFNYVEYEVTREQLETLKKIIDGKLSE